MSQVQEALHILTQMDGSRSCVQSSTVDSPSSCVVLWLS
jgi:hypothetical protein